MSNIYDKQRMVKKGLPYNMPDTLPGMEGVVPQYGSSTPSYKPQGGFSGMDALGMASYLPMIASDLTMAFKAPEYDTEVTGGDWSGYNPTHGLGDELQAAQSINTDNWITQNTSQNALKFAGTGASIGGSIVPGIGHAIGAGAGALFGAVTGFFGGRRKKKKAEEQKAELQRNIASRADAFSDVNIKAKQEYQNKRIALEQIT